MARSRDSQTGDSPDILRKRLSDQSAEIEKLQDQLRQESRRRLRAEERLKPGTAASTPVGSNDRKGTEEELRRSQGRLQQAQKMEALGTLVAGVAHEINNPINMIIYNIPLLQKVWNDLLPAMMEMGNNRGRRKFGGLSISFLQENLGQLLSDMDMAASRVAKIVSDLKNFARQSDVTDKRPMQINQAVENALRLARTYIQKNRSEVEADLADHLPSVEANPQSIEQVIVNILINAVQATEPGKGRIRIRTALEPGSRRVCFSISDNGKGIDPALSDRLFDPFVTDKQALGGTGLGLSVSYRLVKANDGKIVFDSEPGTGTTFTVSFPVIGRPREARILIADDDASIRDIMHRALTRERPYRVDSATNGIEACIRLGSNCPDLLILDIFMPDMDGLEVCRAICKDPALSDVKVLITTGFPHHEKLQEVRKLGFRQIQPKPFKLAALLEKVDAMLSE